MHNWPVLLLITVCSGNYRLVGLSHIPGYMWLLVQTKGCSRKYLQGGGSQALFILWGEGVLLTMCPRRGAWGRGVTCPGGQGVLDP